MKIIFKHTLASVKKNIWQTLIIIITMIVITACIFVSLSATDIFRMNAEIFSREKEANSDVSVGGNIDKQVVDGFVSQYSQYIKHAMYVHEKRFTIKNDVNSTVIVLEICDTDTMLEVLQTPIIQQTENTTQYPSIIVSRIFAESLSVTVGDTVELSTYEEGYLTQTMFVSKIAENSTYFYQRGAYCAMADIDQIDFFGDTYRNNPTACLIYFNSPSSPFPNDELQRTVKYYLADALEHTVNANGPTVWVSCDNAVGVVSKTIGETQNVLNIAVTVMVLVMVLILYFSYSVIAKNRVKEIILFKAAGATPLQTVAIMLFEVVFYAIVGCLLGIAIGRVLNDYIAREVLYSGTAILSYQPWKYIVSLLAGIGTGIASCLVPAFVIGTKSMRQLMTGEMQQSKRTSALVAVVLSLLVVLCFVLLFTLPDYALYSIIALVFLGCLWVVAVTPFLLKILCCIVGKIHRTGEGKVATMGMFRNGGIATVTTMLAVLICFIWMGISIINVIGVTQRDPQNNFASDFIVSSVKDLSTPEMLQQLEVYLSMDGIDEGVAYRVFNASIYDAPNTQANAVRSRQVFAMSDGTGLKYFSDNYDPAVAQAFNNTQKPVVLSYQTAVQFELKVGDQITLFAYIGFENSVPLDGTFTVVGIDHSYGGENPFCAISLHDLVSEGNSNSLHYMPHYALNGDDGKFVSLRQQIDNPTDTLFRTKNYYIVTEGKDLFVMMDYIAGFFYAVSAVGLINLIIVTALDRKREMEIFRLVGLTDRGAFRLAGVEGFIISLSGILMGLLLAIGVSQLQPVFCSLIGKEALFNMFPPQMFIIAAVAAFITLVMWILSPLCATSIVNSKNKKSIHGAD